jgi:predicted component of type VI protein secretion system
MAPQSFQLVIRTGPNPGKTYELNKSEITIGRESVNDIMVNDAEVSRKHARLLLQPGGYMLEDLGSTNGTFVSGQRLMGPHSLQPGELIVLGENVSLSYEAAQFDPEASVIQLPPSSSPVQDFPEPTPEEVQPLTRKPQAPPYQPPAAQAYPPVSQPEYSDQAPAVPDVPQTPPEKRSRATQNWILAGCGCLLLSLCACVGVVFLLDQLNLLCNPTLRPFVNLVLDIVNPILGTTYYCP